MQYRSCNIIFDASIRNDKNSVWIWEEVFEDFVKDTKVFYEVYQRTGKLYLNDCWCLQLNSWLSNIVWMLSYLLIDDRILFSSDIDHLKVN